RAAEDRHGPLPAAAGRRRPEAAEPAARVRRASVPLGERDLARVGASFASLVVPSLLSKRAATGGVASTLGRRRAMPICASGEGSHILRAKLRRCGCVPAWGGSGFSERNAAGTAARVLEFCASR